MSLEKATEKVKAMASANSGALGNTVKFEFQEGTIFLDDSSLPTTVSNEDKEAACTIKMELRDFNQLIDGDLDPMSAFMGGAMKIDGDMGVAMKLSSLF